MRFLSILDDGRIFLSNNAADRTRRGIALIAGSNAADGARP
jgi:hypothetical protein